MKEIKIEDLKLNPAKLFGTDWCLAGAGNQENGYNAMTIAWGHLGAIRDRNSSQYAPLIISIKRRWAIWVAILDVMKTRQQMLD